MKERYRTRRKTRQRGGWPFSPAVVRKTKLHTAVENKDLAGLKVLLALDTIKSKIDVQDNNGFTALHYAVKNKFTEGLHALILAGANIHIKDNRGYTALQYAAENRFTEGVHTLTRRGAIMDLKDDKLHKALVLAGANIDIKDHEGYTALYYKVKSGDMDGVRALILAGADVNQLNNGLTLPIIAAHNGRLEVMNILIDAGADINKESGRNRISPLIIALEDGHIDVANLLIEKGADINVRDTDGSLAIKAVIISKLSSYDKTVMIQTLIERGADVNTRFRYKGTLLTWAIYNSMVELALILIEKGADIHNDSPIMYAVEKNLKDVVKVLIERGADVNVKQSNTNYTPLHYAALNGNMGLAELLIPAGADINAKNTIGETPLILSILKKHVGLAQMLISAGADINANNNNGLTPAFFAARGGHIELLERLLRNEAFDKEKIIYSNKTLYDIARDEPHVFYNSYYQSDLTNQIIALIKELAKPNEKMWNGGWDRGDISRLDLVFENVSSDDSIPPPSSNYACCPVCLQLAERQSGCMYVLNHNCSESGRPYHKNLYKKYKSQTNGNIQWCALCGRIAREHRHYRLAPAQGDIPYQFPADDYYARDCRGYIGGGGLPEKVARFRKLREAFLTHLEDINKKPYIEVLNKIVEAVWNAPLDPGYKELSERILAEKKWDIPLDIFPVSLEKEDTVNITKLPDIVKPEEERALVRTEQGEGQNFLGSDGMLYKLHSHNEDTYITPAGLAYYITGIVDGYSNGTDKESLGTCFTPNCKYKLYPEDIKGLVPDDLYNQYRHIFNFKFRKTKGGARNIHTCRNGRCNKRTRETKKRG